jgi:Flp pilus assembly protein TadG
MDMRNALGQWRRYWVSFLTANRGNVAMMFALSLLPITLAAGAGLDLARATMIKSSLSAALDSAALAIGSQGTKPASCTASSTDSACVALSQLANNYFHANYKPDASNESVGDVTVTINGQRVILSVHDDVNTTLLAAAGLPTMDVNAASTVVWGTSKLWVTLVLDNTGSMTQTDSTGTSKISALKSAAHSLLTTLQGASANAGDVQVSIVPFSKLVNVGTANSGAAWIDWTDWGAPPRDKNGNLLTVPTNTGPGTACPWTSTSQGVGCVTAADGGTSLSTIATGGNICPSVMQAYNAATGSGGHYFNGCFNSVATGSTQNFSCTGSSGSCSCTGLASCSCSSHSGTRTCTWTVTPYSHTWVPAAHSNWKGCIEDRPQSYDAQNDAPVSGNTLFPAANDDSCPPATVMGMSYDWTALGNKIDSMVAQGSTNQTIGLAHGWQTLTPGAPYGTPSLPANTSQFIILVSDGLNTQDRWHGDGSNQSASVDARMASACANAKAAGITIYTIFVDLGGTQGNSTVLQNCATDSTKYFDLKTSGAIITTFNSIAQQLTSLRVSG